MIRTKIATIGLSMALVLGTAGSAGAVTVAELQAQINALMAQLASLQGGATMSTGTTFTRDLTIGSTGADVSALQQLLVSNGHLVMPAGVAMGYFGNLTKAAVMKWQASVGLPATGFFGPMSRAKVNAMGGATGTVPGATVGGTVGSTVGISTPGVEATLTVSKNPNPASGTKLYEGSDKVAVLGLKLEAKTGDVKVERVKVDLDTVAGGNNDQDLYNKIADKIYVMDGSTVLASMDLNSSTVVKDGTDYFITITGFSFVVPKDSTKVLTIAVRGRSTWDSAFDTDTWSFGVPIDGIRGIDGAGINQYGPATAFTNNFTTEGSLVDSATLTISTASDTPQDRSVVCTLSSSEDECDKLELLKVNLKAEKDDVLLTDMIVSIVKNMTTSIPNNGGAATTSTAYLYDGSTLVGSATIGNHTGGTSATFTDIDYKVMKDQTKALSLQIDVQDTTIANTTFDASTTASQLTAENMSGTGITESGSATSESVSVRKVGPELTLVSKSITYSGTGGFAGATTTAKADFVIRMKAVGGDVVFGDSASTTYPLVVLGIPTGAGSTATSSVIYRGGAAVSGSTIANNLNNVSSSTAITVPSGVTATTSNSWTLAEGNTIDIPVSMVFNARNGNSAVLGDGAEITTGAYAVQINQIFWATPVDVGERHAENWMSGNSAWRTGTVTLP